MGNLRMMCVSSMMRVEPRDSPRWSRTFATAVCPGIEPHRSAPSKIAPWVQPQRSAEGDRTEVDPFEFVLVVDDDHTQVPGALEVLSKPMDLTALLRVVERYLCGDRSAGA
jgi:hypothetical protein